MTLLAKARRNRLVALAVTAELRKRAAAPAAPVFKSRRTADNLNHAPLAAVRAA